MYETPSTSNVKVGKHFQSSRDLYNNFNKSHPAGHAANSIIRDGNDKAIAIKCNCGNRHPITIDGVEWLININPERIATLKLISERVDFFNVFNVFTYTDSVSSEDLAFRSISLFGNNGKSVPTHIPKVGDLVVSLLPNDLVVSLLPNKEINYYDYFDTLKNCGVKFSGHYSLLIIRDAIKNELIDMSGKDIWFYGPDEKSNLSNDFMPAYHYNGYQCFEQHLSFPYTEHLNPTHDVISFII